jgi:hypothetical protein
VKMRGKPDISDFIEGAGAAEKPRRSKTQAQVRQKGVRLPLPMLAALRRRALDETEAKGRRVTEQEIIIAALTRYLDSKLS